MTAEVVSAAALLATAVTAVLAQISGLPPTSSRATATKNRNLNKENQSSTLELY